MAFWRAFGTLAIALWAGHARAASCTTPPPVADYMKQHPAVRLVQTNDLVDDDQQLWSQARRGLCPGLAAVRLNDGTQVSYALGLLRKSNGAVYEDLILLRPSGDKWAARRLAGPIQVGDKHGGSPFVVWRTPPGPVEPFGGGPRSFHRNDGIVFEKIEATSTVYYFDGRTLRSVLATD